MRQRSTVLLASLALLQSGCFSTVRIRTEPEGAEVWVDGRYQGRSPVEYGDADMVGSRHQVRLEKEGYETYRTSFSRSGQLNPAAFVGGICCLVPFLWVQDYPDRLVYPLRPLADYEAADIEPLQTPLHTGPPTAPPGPRSPGELRPPEGWTAPGELRPPPGVAQPGEALPPRSATPGELLPPPRAAMPDDDLPPRSAAPGELPPRADPGVEQDFAPLDPADRSGLPPPPPPPAAVNPEAVPPPPPSTARESARPECVVGANGQVCGYNCAIAPDGTVDCASSPEARCTVHPDGRLECP